jgi:hypothetical protein
VAFVIASVVAKKFTATAEPVAGVVVTFASEIVLISAEFCAAFTGTTDKSPNPIEATATADTFFNEIVFTIFLSFSRFQAFPGLGWWSKRPPH